MEQKFVSFLKKHELYNFKCFSYFEYQAVKIDYEDIKDVLFLDCVLETKFGYLQGFIPIVPYLSNDKTVAMNIYAYVQALQLIPKVGKKYEEQFIHSLLPLLYLRLYLVENANEVLWNYEKSIEHKLLNDESEQSKILLQQIDHLIEIYYFEGDSAKKMGVKTKRLAKNYLYKNTDLFFSNDKW